MDLTDYFDTRLGGYAVIVRDDHVLLALWNEPEVPTWTLPGGGIDLHEDLEDGVVREVLEESGYDVELTGLVGVHTFAVQREERWLRHVHVAFTARVVGGELTAEVDGSTDEARWIPLAEVPVLPRSEQVRRFVG